MAHQIIQITDTHLKNTTGAKQMHQQFSPNDKLDLVFEDITNNNHDASLIAISGDLIHEGNQDDYRKLRNYLDAKSKALGMPIYVTLGNHDRTEAFYNGYLNQPAKPKYYYKVTQDDYDYYFLDTKYLNVAPGYLDQTQLSWLTNELNQSANPALIFMHHPAYGTPLKNMKSSILQNGDALYEVLNGHDVRGVFAGHVHYPASYLRDGILNVIGDSTAYHIDCRDPHDHVYYDSTSYNVIDIDGGQIGSSIIYLLSDGKLTRHINGHIKVKSLDFIDKSKFTG